MISEHDRAYLRGLRPRRAPLVFCRPARCSTGLLGDRGCGFVTRVAYMTGGKVRPTWGVCPICGHRYDFAFWKLSTDRSRWKPTAEQEADLRTLYADWKRMAKSEPPTYVRQDDD